MIEVGSLKKKIAKNWRRFETARILLKNTYIMFAVVFNLLQFEEKRTLAIVISSGFNRL